MRNFEYREILINTTQPQKQWSRGTFYEDVSRWSVTIQLSSLIANLAYSELMLNAYTLKSTNDVTYLLYYENIAYSELAYCV